MKVCLIYSGWLRTWEQCKQNHTDCLSPTPDHVVHYNETLYQVNPFDWEEFAHYRANKAPENEPGNTVNMWHAMYHSWLMAPGGFDCYVRIRYDIIIEGPINFEDYEMRPDTVYIPEGQDYGGVNDQFAFGSRTAMEQYFSVYLDHETHFNAGKMFHSESYLKHTLDMRGIKIVRIPVTNRILRA